MHIKYNQMRDNKPFSAHEDEIIKEMYETKNIKKWSMIARVLTQEYKYPRNAKQCRDRYQQYLDPMMVSEWNVQQEEKLYNLHNEIGNKWAVIAQKFPGRTDNCVKNHFYSKLRKSLRHLNKVIKKKFKKEFKQLKIGAIYKIIQALQDRFNENTMIDQQAFNKCIRLKKQLLEYSNRQNDNQQGDFQKQKELIQQINEFSRNYKRKTKKQRRSSLNGAELFKPATLQKRIKYSSDQQSSESEYSLVHSHSHNAQSENQSEQSQINLGVIQEDIRQSLGSKYFEPGLRFTQKVENQEEGIRNSEKIRGSQKVSYKSHQLHSVQEILRQKNVLEQGNIFVNKKQASLCSFSFHSDSQKPDMFDDNLRISEGLRNVQEMQEESPEQNIFRSHK